METWRAPVGSHLIREYVPRGGWRERSRRRIFAPGRASVCDSFCQVVAPAVPVRAQCLTVWNITDTQQALLREGNVVKFSEILAVKATKQEGLLQLTARETTPMHETVCRKEVHFVGRFRSTGTALRLFHHHALSGELYWRR
jgi:hypothetical protein